MGDREPCCLEIVPGGPSPFEIHALFNWWDGLIDGMARCRACRRTYHFDMIAWDHQQDVRVYGLRPVSPEGYERVLALMAVPPPTPQEAEARADAITRSVAHAIGMGGVEIALLIASMSLGESIVAARPASFWDWRSILGFDHVASADHDEDP